MATKYFTQSHVVRESGQVVLCGDLDDCKSYVRGTGMMGLKSAPRIYTRREILRSLKATAQAEARATWQAEAEAYEFRHSAEGRRA